MENFKAFESKLDEYLNNLDREKPSYVDSNQGYGLALIACNKYFNGRFIGCLITAKKKIVDMVQQKLTSLKDTQIGTLKQYFKYITADNSFLLNEGALTLYLGLADLIKRQQSKYSSDSQSQDDAQFKKILRGIIKLLKPLLLFYFINRQCNKRINSISCYLIKSHSKISSQKKIVLEESEKNKKNTSQQNQNEHILLQIQAEFSNYSISELIDRYLKEQENKIIDSTEICRMCEQKIKLKELEFHIKNCSRRTKLQAQLKVLEQKSKQLYEEVLSFEKKIIFKQNQCQERQLHVLKILRMMKQAYLGTKRAALIRRNTQLNNIKKQPIQEIKKQLELFQKSYGRDELLSNLVKNKQEIMISKRKLAMIQINSISKISSSKGSDIGSFKSLQSSINNAFVGTNGLKTKKSLFASKNSNKVESKHSNQKGKKHSIQNSRPKSSSSSQSSSQSQSKSSKSSISIKSQSNLESEKQNSENNSIKNLMSSSLGPSKFKQIKNLGSRFSKKQILQKNSKSLKNVYHFEETQEQKMGLSQFDILKFLGKGAFGKVYLVRRKTTKDVYALKHIIIQDSENKTQMQLIKNQHQIFKQIAGNHLIRAPFAFTETFGHFFVLQFMPGGDLSQILCQQVYLQQDHAKFYLAQIILALEHLHNCGIIHRDLKPQNIVIDRNGHTKLTDFGLSEIKIQDKIVKVKQKFDLNRRMTRERANRRVALVRRTDAAKVIGTPDYIAPQIINQISINNASIDWWSLGVMAYEMIVGCHPFSALLVNQVLANIVEGKIQWPQIGREQGMMSPQAFDLISKLLDKNFQRRLGSSDIQQIKSHPFFEGIDWMNIKKQKPPMVPKNIVNMMKQYSKLTQNPSLRLQITQVHKISLKSAKKDIGLQNFVRYDFLLQQTYESVELRINKQKTKFERIKTIGSFIEDEEEKQNNKVELKQEKPTENQLNVALSPQPKCRKISARKSKNVCFNIE